LRNAGFHPLAQDLALKLRKDRQEPGHRSPHRRGQIQRFAEGDKADPEALKLVERPDEVCERAAPAI
jgi:hypothetical protein